jgi:hypothetical protein
MNLEKRQNESLVLDRRIFGAGAPFFINRQREKSINNREGNIKIQAFHKPNSNAGIRDTISLFTVTTINYLTFLV